MIMIIAFFILLVLVLLLIIPVKFKISFDYNIFKNRGFLKIKLFNFKMFYYKLKLNKNKIVLSNFKTTKELNLEINKKNIDYAKELQNEILKRLYLKELIVYFNFDCQLLPCRSNITVTTLWFRRWHIKMDNHWYLKCLTKSNTSSWL